ncbi:hypothetical protein MPSEU_000572700 [Mayamaea pseudoterrestris]|nr:hypothetical protein MPSEU_000572700 [Mayamaea pseudoterrestris]
MNCKEHHIPELELSTGQVREALQCILHTILFIRSPGPVKPSQVECEGFRLTYTRISATLGTHAPRSSLENDLDQKINQAIETFLRSLSQIGPELLSGCLTLSFLERRASRQLFGLMSHEEKVVFEQWVIRIVVNNTPRPIGNDSAAVIERQRIEDMGEGMLRSALAKVFEIVGGPVDHVPPVQYEFEIACTKRADDRENMYTRVANMPPILNLSS